MNQFMNPNLDNQGRTFHIQDEEGKIKFHIAAANFVEAAKILDSLGTHRIKIVEGNHPTYIYMETNNE